MFTHSTALESSNNIYFDLPYLSQESMVLSQLQIAYLYYLEVSLTVLQIYRITACVNLWLSPLKHQKVKKQQKIDKWIIIKALWIYLLGISLGEYIKICGPRPPKVTSYCVKSVQILSYFWCIFGHFSRSVKFKIILAKIV